MKTAEAMHVHSCIGGARVPAQAGIVIPAEAGTPAAICTVEERIATQR